MAEVSSPVLSAGCLLVRSSFIACRPCSRVVAPFVKKGLDQPLAEERVLAIPSTALVEWYASWNYWGPILFADLLALTTALVRLFKVSTNYLKYYSVAIFVIWLCIHIGLIFWSLVFCLSIFDLSNFFFVTFVLLLASCLLCFCAHKLINNSPAPTAQLPTANV